MLSTSIKTIFRTIDDLSNLLFRKVLKKIYRRASEFVPFFYMPSLLKGYEKTLCENGQPIDAVFTFVDMSDKAWSERWSVVTGEKAPEHRYSNNGELEFSIELLRKYCPWINRIYIVTPTPDKVDISGPDIEIVLDDDLIGPECAKPTFKSCSIESYLHKIPNLSEYFFSLCDDYFVGDYVDKSDFIDEDGVVTVFLQKFNNSKIFRNEKRLRTHPWEHDIFNASELMDRKFGQKFHLTYTHQMTIMSKSACELTWQFFKEELELSVRNPLRNPPENTIHFILLSQFVAIKTGKLKLSTKKQSTMLLGNASQNIFSKLDQIVRCRPRYFCLNTLDLYNPRYFELFKHKMRNRPEEGSRIFYVCSFGGCGSTMLSKFLKRYGLVFHVHSRVPPEKLTTVIETPHKPFAKEWFSDTLAPQQKRITVIYLYRNPTYTLLAETGAKGKRLYNPLHLKNIQVKAVVPATIQAYIKDSIENNTENLGYGEFFENYTSAIIPKNYDIYCMDYDRIWDNLEEIYFALGLPLGDVDKFPKKKDRDRQYNDSDVEGLNVIYSQLYRKMSLLPPVYINKGQL